MLYCIHTLAYLIRYWCNIIAYKGLDHSSINICLIIMVLVVVIVLPLSSYCLSSKWYVYGSFDG